MVDRVGQQLGSYRLIKQIGEGGFAEVYLGEHIHLGTQAAVKVLTTRLTDEGIAQFRNEARTLIDLQHPNIVQVLDFGMQDRIPFIVMRYAPNGSLRKLYPSGACLPLQTIVAYVMQVGSALQYAHDQKLIHRDVKPDNMLIGRNNEILLSDFGIASIAHNTTSLNTQDRGAGTIPYMAPEQLQGKPRTASDQYSLGIVTYEWLTGVRPFKGTAWEIISQHMSAPPPCLHEHIPAIPLTIENVVLTALAKDPHQRFTSVQEFASAFEQACQPPISPVSPDTSSRHYIPTSSTISPNPSPILSTAPTTPLSQSSVLANASILPNPSSVLSPTQQGWPIPLSSPANPSVSQSFKRRGISRRVVLAGLVGLVVAGGGLTWFALSLRPTHSGVVTITGTVKSVDAANGSVTLTVNGQDVTINGLSSQQVAQLQSQVGKKYSITAIQNLDGSFTIASGSNAITITNSATEGTPIGASGNPQQGTILFYGKVVSANGNTIIVSMPDGSQITVNIVNGTTDLSDFANTVPPVGTTIQVQTNANTDGSYVATALHATSSSDPTVLNTVNFAGVTVAAVGSDRVLHFTVGNKSYSDPIASTADLGDFNGNAQGIQANQQVKVVVLFNGAIGRIIKVSLNNGQ